MNVDMIFHNEDLIKALFPEVFSSLGKLGKHCAIKLKPDTKSFCLKMPKWIPFIVYFFYMQILVHLYLNNLSVKS